MTLLLIARRELAHHLNSGLAPILLLVFVIAMPIPIYWANTPTNLFINGHVDLRAFFAMFPLYLMVLVPCLAMRTWSEERAQGTLETLLTMPLGETELVLGKFLGNYLLLVVAVLGTLATPLGRLDWGPVVGGYLGALLLAAFCLALAMLVGMAARNQITAFILGFTVLALSMFARWPGLNPPSRFVNIARGVLDSRDFFFYLFGTCLFLLLGITLLRARRFR